MILIIGIILYLETKYALRLINLYILNYIFIFQLILMKLSIVQYNFLLNGCKYKRQIILTSMSKQYIYTGHTQ